MKVLLTLLFLTACSLYAQNPQMSSWILNTTGQTGYNGYTTNVQKVAYTGTDVYVSCTCIPGYDIGPWQSNPNVPVPENFTFKITRNPQKNTGTPVQTALGHTGVWTNGVSIFNAKDGMSYNNQGVWNRDALYWEGISFDNCLGHPAPNGEYHHHVSPTCLYNDKDSLHHSPIIGFAFDGFPIYGAYGFTNTDGSGAIKRMQSSFVRSSASTRTNGPAVSTQYPAGCFIEDFSYVAGSGDLDEHNGRFCVTPEYPAGTYAYFVTIDANRKPVYPYTPGPTYYGTVQQGNTGPNGGHNTVPANATIYTPSSTAPTISVAMKSSDACEGSALSFNSAITLGGSTPSYQWYRNGVAVGTNSAVYQDTVFKNNDSVWCVLTSSDASASPSTAKSNVLYLQLGLRTHPSLKIAGLNTNSICPDATAQLEAQISDAGTNPQVRWLLNDKQVGTGTKLILTSINNNDSLRAECTSSDICASPKVASSPTLVFSVYPGPEKPIISQQVGTLHCSVKAAAYQWYVNASVIVGATAQDYVFAIAGNYTVSVIDAQGCRKSSDPLAVQTSSVDAQSDSEIRVVPNPCTSVARLHVDRPFVHCTLRILDELSRTVYIQHDLTLSPEHSYVLPVHTMSAPGAYIIELQSDNERHEIRCIKD